MTLDYCPHGYYRRWRGGSYAIHYIPPRRQSPAPRATRLRDAAMWASFVHELRAELAEAMLREVTRG